MDMAAIPNSLAAFFCNPRVITVCAAVLPVVRIAFFSFIGLPIPARGKADCENRDFGDGVLRHSPAEQTGQ
ncbi:MAG: hypothetical protein IKQ04_10650 [Oscillospiraceae bacterium]|nr:hypothetical protein [Oscillospiraceae bacterium]